MPELPDIQLYLDRLAPRVVGKTLRAIRLASPFLVRSVTPPLGALDGRPVTGLGRVGKRIVLEFDDELFLVLHLMIAGRLRWREEGAGIPARSGLAAFDFEGGTLVLTEAGSKRRASIHVVRGQSSLRAMDPGGIEVLDADLETFRSALIEENRTLKRALTDPRRFSGIGNAYSDEILHAARLSPAKLTRSLTGEESERLYRAARGTLSRWIEVLRGESPDRFPERVTAFRNGMAVHGRYGHPFSRMRSAGPEDSLRGAGVQLLRALPDRRTIARRPRAVSSVAEGLAPSDRGSRVGREFVARKFHNPDPAHRPHTMRAVFRWGVTDRLLGRRRREHPGPPAPRVAPDLTVARDRPDRTTLTWIGHASFLATLGGSRVLIDPVFSHRISAVVRRRGRAGLASGDLPSIDALLITHVHYDHLDRPSLRALAKTVPVFVPLGVGGRLRRWGFENVVELDWWQSARAGALRVSLVPARHWSRRAICDTNETLWGGFVFEAGGASMYHAGDTAWFDGFAEIGRRFPGIDVAMVPIGAYSPAWFMEHQHLNPAQAGRAFLDTGARRLVPMHWGAFQLADEPLCEPADRMRSWWRTESPGEGRKLVVPVVGRTEVFDD